MKPKVIIRKFTQEHGWFVMAFKSVASAKRQLPPRTLMTKFISKASPGDELYYTHGQHKYRINIVL